MILQYAAFGKMRFFSSGYGLWGGKSAGRRGLQKALALVCDREKFMP